jgi:hypothetical protein
MNPFPIPPNPISLLSDRSLRTKRGDPLGGPLSKGVLGDWGGKGTGNRSVICDPSTVCIVRRFSQRARCSTSCYHELRPILNMNSLLLITTSNLSSKGFLRIFREGRLPHVIRHTLLCGSDYTFILAFALTLIYAYA